MRVKFKVYSFNSPDCKADLVPLGIYIGSKQKYGFKFEGEKPMFFYAENFHSATLYAKNLFRNRAFPDSIFDGGRHYKKEYDIVIAL